MNFTVIIVTAIICAALVAIFWIDSKKGKEKK